MLEIFGNIPLWAILIIITLIAVVAWKLIKFAIKILIVVVVFFAILIGLDVIGVFTWINENIISSFM
ncbi:MAG: hypothetical protein KAV40_02920 [Thermoplasmatales archaeon]|nr:hypothetical protein [Thermoplasmatales archaeon]